MTYPMIVFQQQFYPSKRFIGEIINIKGQLIDVKLHPSLEQEIKHYLLKTALVLIYLDNETKPLIAIVNMVDIDLDKHNNLIIEMKFKSIKDEELKQLSDYLTFK